MGGGWGGWVPSIGALGYSVQTFLSLHVGTLEHGIKQETPCKTLALAEKGIL